MYTIWKYVINKYKIWSHKSASLKTDMGKCGTARSEGSFRGLLWSGSATYTLVLHLYKYYEECLRNEVMTAQDCHNEWSFLLNQRFIGHTAFVPSTCLFCPSIIGTRQTHKLRVILLQPHKQSLRGGIWELVCQAGGRSIHLPCPVCLSVYQILWITSAFLN